MPTPSPTYHEQVIPHLYDENNKQLAAIRAAEEARDFPLTQEAVNGRVAVVQRNDPTCNICQGYTGLPEP